MGRVVVATKGKPVAGSFEKGLKRINEQPKEAQ